MPNTVDLATLKQFRNSIIGSPTSKLTLIRAGHLPHILDVLRTPPGSLELRIEATHVVGSLCRDIPCMPYLLKEDTPSVLLSALKVLPHTSASVFDEEHMDETDVAEPERSRDALEAYTRGLARALSELTECMDEAVFGARNGIGRQYYEGRMDAAVALQDLFQLESLDTFLPLLNPPIPTPSNLLAAAVSIAHLISAIQSPDYRAVLLDWLPPAERLTAAKGKRGWERKEEGGWVTNRLIALLKTNNEKAQVESMAALATLLDKNPTLVTTFGRFHAPIAQRMFDLSRARSPEVRLSACTALTSILRHRGPAQKSALRQTSDAEPTPPSNLLLNVISTLNALIEDKYNPLDLRTSACWGLSYLVTDDRERATYAADCGCLKLLANVMRSWPAVDPTDTDELEEEGLAMSRFREATMTTIASMTLHSPNLRSQLSELKPPVLGIVHTSLAHPSPLVRHAACQIIRSMSRSVALLRSALVDEPVATSILGLVLREGDVAPDPTLSGKYTREEGDGGEDVDVDMEDADGEGGGGRERKKGDRRVLMVALAALSNFAAEFSPMHHWIMEQNALPTLIRYSTCPTDPMLRMNGLWVLKNFVYRADWELKRTLTGLIGWSKLGELLEDPDMRVREQAFSVLRNLAASRESDVLATLDGLGLDLLTKVIEDALATGHEDVQINALLALVNFIPQLLSSPISPSHPIASSPPLYARSTFLAHLLAALSSPSQPLRLAAIRTIHAFVSNDVGAREMSEAGIEGRVREMEGRGRRAAEGEDGREGSEEVRDWVKKVVPHFERYEAVGEEAPPT